MNKARRVPDEEKTSWGTSIREYINEEAGVVIVGDEVYIREGEDNYVSKYLILEEYANMFKVRDIDTPNGLIKYVTKETFSLINGDGALKQLKEHKELQDKEGKLKFWQKRRFKKRGKEVNTTPLKKPITTTTVAGTPAGIQPAGSSTGAVNTTHQRTAGDSYVSGYGYGGLYGRDKWGCHTGNTIIGTRTIRKTGFNLMIGGWSRGAHEPIGGTVIDLTGYGRGVRGQSSYFYNFKVKDYSTPYWDDFFWRQLAELVYYHLEYGDVLIACQGGHGRSGLVAAVVAGLIRDKQDFALLDDEIYFTNPVAWIRKVHCHHAIETYEQERLVVNVLLSAYPTSKRLKLCKQTMRAPKYDKYKAGKKSTTKNRYSPVPTKGSKSAKESAKVLAPQDVDDDVIAAWQKEDDDWLDTWVTENWDTIKDEEENIPSLPMLCPICLTKHKTYSEASLCCNSKGHNQFCPMCGKWNRTPKDAIACCSRYNTGFTQGDEHV